MVEGVAAVENVYAQITATLTEFSRSIERAGPTTG